MSYAFGGYTLYLPRDRIQPLDISVEDAMRLAITAGLTAAGTRTQVINCGACRSWRLLARARAGDALALARAGGRHRARRVAARTSIRRGGRAAAQILIGRGDARSLATAAALAHSVWRRDPRRIPPPQVDRRTRRQGERAGSGQSQAIALAAPATLRQHAGLRHPRRRHHHALGRRREQRRLDCDIGGRAEGQRTPWKSTRILADMAQGHSFDVYWNRTVVLLFDALKQAARRAARRIMCRRI